jgi:hypothetical protein
VFDPAGITLTRPYLGYPKYHPIIAYTARSALSTDCPISLRVFGCLPCAGASECTEAGVRKALTIPAVRGAALETEMLDAQGTFVAAHRIVELQTEAVIRTRPWTYRWLAHVNSSSSLFASFRSVVSKPSVNQA